MTAPTLDHTEPIGPQPEPATSGLRPAVQRMLAELDAHFKGADCGSITDAMTAMQALSDTSPSWGSRNYAAQAVGAYKEKHNIPTKPAPAKKPTARTKPPTPRRTPPVPPAVRAEPVPMVEKVVPPPPAVVQAEPAPVVRQPVPQPTAGIGWARFGFGLGVVASTAANIAHSFTPSADVVRRTNELAAATGQTVDWSTWTPPVGTIIAAAFWPIALVVSVEVISRVMWPDGWRWKLMRFGGISVVAAVAAFISYKHLHGLIGSYGEDAWSAAVGPLAIDGLMVVCSAALLAIGQNKRSAAQEA